MYHITRNVTSKYGAYVRSIQCCSSCFNVRHAHRWSDNQRSERFTKYDHWCNDSWSNNNYPHPTYAFATNKLLKNILNNNFILQRHSFHISSAFLKEDSSKVEDFVEHQKEKLEKKKKIIAASQRFQEAFIFRVDPSLAEPKGSIKDVATPGVVVKVPLGTRIVQELKHYYNGFRLLYLDTKIAARLLWRTMNGKSLTRREMKQFLRTVSDLFRLLPFSVFLIIPFMEFLLPVAIKLFPGMLPSTFEDAKSKEAKRRVSLKMRLKMAEFLQDTIEEISVSSKRGGIGGKKPNEKLKEFAEFVSRTRTESNPPSNGEIVKYSKLFEDEITLENIPHDHLKAMCRIMMISPIGTGNFLRFKIRLKLEELKADDQIIRREGIDNLSNEELQLACSNRGMRSLGLSVDRLKSNLKQWLELSLDQKIPASLLLLSRTFYMQYDQVEQLKLTISHLPERLIDEMELKIGAVEGEVVDRQTIIDIIKHEEEQIKVEKLQRKKDDEEILEVGVKEDLSKEELLKVKETLSLSEREKFEEIKGEREEYIEDVQELKLVQKNAVESVASTRLGRRLDAMLQKVDKSLQQIEDDVSHLPSGMIDEDEDGIVTTQELVDAISTLRNAPDEAKTKRLLEVMDDDSDGVIDLGEMRMAVKLLATEDLDLSPPQVAEVLALLKNTERIFIIEQMLNKRKTNYLIQLLPTVYSRKNVDK